MGLLACLAVMLIFYRDGGKQSVLAQYTMQVYLMHTIFAAGTRVFLLKIGVADTVPHVVLGLVASFAGPVFAGKVMEKFKLDILYQPGRYIKLKR